jgi:Tfp pilus assembly protein FimT
MVTRSLLILVAVLLLASPAFSQFAPQARVTDLADRLSRDAQTLQTPATAISPTTRARSATISKR